jgi:hypothetical protein
VNVNAIWRQGDIAGQSMSLMLQRKSNRIPLLVITVWLAAASTVSPQVLYQVTNMNTEFLEGGLQYSPDGSRVAICYKFSTGDAGRMALLNLQTGTPFNILYSNSPDSGAHSFCWEPDGTHLLISMMRSATRDYDLYRGSIFGGQLENITNTPNQSEFWPKYSHNGNWLAYSASVSGIPGVQVRLKNTLTGQDTMIYSWAPTQFGDYSWCPNDTAMTFNTYPPAQWLYLCSPMPAGNPHFVLVGRQTSFAPDTPYLIFNKIYIDSTSGILRDSSDFWIYQYDTAMSPQNPSNFTRSYGEISGMKTDPDWYPGTNVNALIFLKKHRAGNIWLGDVWMLWDFPLDVPDLPAVIPFQYRVGMAYPNPFNATTTIPLTLERAVPVRWELYNLLGQRVLQESPGTLTPGLHRISVDGNRLASGNYWMVVTIGNTETSAQREIRRLVLLK